MDRQTVIDLLMTHRGMLIGYIDAILRDFQLSEDVFQEVSLLMIDRAEDLQDVDGFGPWARAFARFKALNVMRKTRRYPVLMDEQILDSLEERWEEHDNEYKTHTLAKLRECMDTLSDNARELIKMRYFEQVSGIELAKRQNKKVNAVYVMMSRIHAALGKCVRKKLEDTGLQYG